MSGHLGRAGKTAGMAARATPREGRREPGDFTGAAPACWFLALGLQNHPTRGAPMHPTHDARDALDVLVIGAGQAGLATAYHLRRRGLRFLVVDAGRELGHSWRSRWDSLRLFTPAQYDGLPGMPFPAPADTTPQRTRSPTTWRRTPRGSSCRSCWTAGYAGSSRPMAGTSCTPPRARSPRTRSWSPPARSRRRSSPAWPTGSAGTWSSCTARSTATPTQLPAGPVVVVGAGNSGRQIALELAATGSPGHARGRDRVDRAAAAAARPRPVLVADQGRGHHQDRRLAPGPPDAGAGATWSSAPPWPSSARPA